MGNWATGEKDDCKAETIASCAATHDVQRMAALLTTKWTRKKGKGSAGTSRLCNTISITCISGKPDFVPNVQNIDGSGLVQGQPMLGQIKVMVE